MVVKPLSGPIRAGCTSLPLPGVKLWHAEGRHRQGEESFTLESLLGQGFGLVLVLFLDGVHLLLGELVVDETSHLVPPVLHLGVKGAGV